MATVKLNAPRNRGELEYAAGDTYECSDTEAAVLVAGGYASVVLPVRAQQIEAAAVVAPETADQPKPTARKTKPKE